MKKPNADGYKPDIDYIRSIIEESGLTQNEVARRIGVAPRSLRANLDDSGSVNARPMPYTVHYAIECLCKK